MERSIVAVVDNGQVSESAPVLSKSVSSPIKPNSLVIDLPIPRARNVSEKCQHFSLRGYVAEMREKNRNICLPFASDGNVDNLEEQLPPLHVPKFRWWCCQNFLQDVGAASALELETGEESKCCKIGLTSRSTCPPIPPDCSMEMMLSDIQEASELEKSARGKVDESAPVSLSVDDNYLSPSNHRDGRCTKVAQLPIGHENVEKVEAEKPTYADLCGNENHSSPYNGKIPKNTEAGFTSAYGLENSLDEDNLNKSGNEQFDVGRDEWCPTEERHPGHLVPVESKCSMLVDTCLSTYGSHNATDGFSGPEKSNCEANSSTEVCPDKVFNFVDAEAGNVLAGGRGLKVASEMSKVTPAVKDQLVRHPCLPHEDGANRLLESDGTLTGDNQQNQQNDSSGGFPRRKTRKVRLLTELLGGKKHSENYHRTESRPSNLIPEVPSTSLSLPVPQAKPILYENVRGVVRVPQRKRKMPSDQERKPVNMNCPSNVSKKARPSKGDAEASTRAIEISDSESEEYEDGVAVNNSYKSQWSGRERSALGKNTRKPTEVGGEQLSSVPWREVINKMNHAKMGDASKQYAVADTSYFKLIHDSCTDRGLEPSLRSVMPPQRRERKSTSSKKKNCMLQIEDGQAFARSQTNHIFGEGSVKRKDVESTRTESEAEKLQSEPDVSANLRLDLTLNSYMPSQRDEKDNAEVEGATLPFTPTQKCILHRNLVRKDGLHGESSISHNMTPDPSSKEPILLNLSDKIARRTAIMREQRTHPPHLSNGSYSLPQNLDLSDGQYIEKSSIIRESPEAMSLRSDQSAEMFTKGNHDDIPMEIVELMMKHKHERERGLAQDERSYCWPMSDKKRTDDSIVFPKANGKGSMPFSQTEYPGTSKRKPSPNATIGMTMGANFVPTKRNPLIFSDEERNMFNMGQMGNPPLSVFKAFSPSKLKVPSDDQFSNLGTHRNMNLQNSEPKRKLTAQLSSPTNMKIAEPFSHCHNGMKQSEAKPVWSPNYIQFGHNIFQKFPSESCNIEMGAQFLGPSKGKRIVNFDLNAVDLNGASIEEQNKRASAEFPFLTKSTDKEINPKGMGPVDASHCKETIPAMQLLSLMDAGMLSSKPLGLNGKNFLEKPFSSCSSHPCFATDGKLNFLEKPFFPKSGPMPGPVGSSRELSSALSRKNFPDKCYEHPSVVPAIDSFASLFQNVEKPPGFTDQVLRTQELQKGKGPYSAAHNRAYRSDQSVPPCRDGQKIGDPSPGQNKRKGMFAEVNSLVHPLQRQRIEDPGNCINWGPFFMQQNVRPMKDRPCTDVCTVNRNPADFSVPEAGNEYMISCEDLKCGKKVFPRGKSVLGNMNGQKKRRLTKPTPANECREVVTFADPKLF